MYLCVDEVSTLRPGDEITSGYPFLGHREMYMHVSQVDWISHVIVIGDPMNWRIHAHTMTKNAKVVIQVVIHF